MWRHFTLSISSFRCGIYTEFTDSIRQLEDFLGEHVDIVTRKTKANKGQTFAQNSKWNFADSSTDQLNYSD